jgi:ergothioneine biosynthesis protein EgtB
MSAEDQMVQSCPEASPLKWHQAHTTWFFETFVIRAFCPDYKAMCEDFQWLFNSYYNSLGRWIPKKRLRAYLSRPSLEQVLAYRTHVDNAVQDLLAGRINDEVIRQVLLGINHEQQHQELMLTDIKHAFFSNPLHPAYNAIPFPIAAEVSGTELRWHHFGGGLSETGHTPDPVDILDFCFDNEIPSHKVYLEPFQLASRPVTCREYLKFIADRGYSRIELWLSEGWDAVRGLGWQAPLYWERHEQQSLGWRVFTLRGWKALSDLLDTPVCHISYFEADAFARWWGRRLPTEPEW